MAMNAMIGLQRSGKSYEAVCNVIIPAIQSGRDVVSNIAGLNQQAIYDLLILEGRDPSKFGKIKNVTEGDVLSKNFFLTDKKDPAHCFVKAGDVLVFDEIWRFWPTDQKVPADHLNFFRMHGHFVNQANGFTCEVVFITQAISDIHRSIKATILQTTETVKNTELGSDKTYIINIYTKTNTRKPNITLGPYKYDKKYFPCYVSNSINQSGVKPREERVEKRNNIFSTKLFRFFMPLAVLMLVGGIYGASSFFSPDNQIVKGAENAQPNQSNTSVNGSVSNLPNQVKAPITTSNDSIWRVAGLYGSIDHQRAILINQSGDSRIVIPRTVSQYAEIITITTHTENATFSNSPFTKNQGLIQ